jgi:hypothetical protein
MKVLSRAAVAAFILISSLALAQERATKNVIIITLDGYRWKELFGGADPRILHNKKYVKDTTVVERFGDPSEMVSREKLMPFFWNVIGVQGQLYGNRAVKNKVNCANGHLLSYPGYNEMLVGFNDRTISSNRKQENPNGSVLEFIHQQRDFKNQVAAFSTWDAFPYILREGKSGIYVNAGTDTAAGDISNQEKWLNENQTVIKNPHGSRYDAFTFRYAMEYLRRERPRVMFIGFDETDEHGHGGRYDEYLKSAHQADQMIAELWQWIQSQKDYKDQTTLVITTDHGRGKGKHSWRKHKIMVPGSRQIWFAVLGPDTPGFGEMKAPLKYYQKQIAKTVAAFLGLEYAHVEPVGEVVQTMLAVPALSLNENTTAENSSSIPGRNRD